ncbi:hypothetical protein MPSEU_000777000 [Mayamaea pseudoterrestris]|nr:hypothetical protein MPSEU_000777000 [Mayamaea pseudoterrestris]
MTTYRLKRIRYQNNSNCHILLQNENGPCPLLAAANGLLLRGTLEFPAHCLQHGVASLEDVTNMLANQALAIEDESTTIKSNDKTFHIDELMKWIPQFQNGMDVNLGFTKVDAYEYSAQLTAWDMFRIQLVHGWLVDPQSAEAQVIQTKTYNVLVDIIFQAQDAALELEQLEKEPTDVSTTNYEVLVERQNKLERLQHSATQGKLMEHFLESTSHQLTAYGLEKLREHLSEDQLAVFFRNNHFALMTKHDGELYLLVTDLGYADSQDIVWERLDAIDGNTTLVNADFCENTQRGKEEEAYQMALQLSLQQQQQQGTTVALPPVSEGTRAALHEPAIAEQLPMVAVGMPTMPKLTSNPASSGGEVPRLPVDVGVAGSSELEHAVGAPARQPVDADIMLARQLQADWNSESTTDDAASLQLALQLQAEENARSQQQRSTTPAAAPRPSRASSQNNCMVS